MEPPPCPLCQQTKKMRKPLKLYGVPICRKCYYKFANRRQIAYLLDWIVWLPIAILLGFGLGLVMGILQLKAEMQFILEILIGWIFIPLIFCCKDGFAGHSLGKVVCGVQVVHRESFNPMGFLASLKRNLPLLIPLMPLIIAFLLQKGYRFGDGWANTKVVWKKYANHPVFTGLLACEQCQYDLKGNETGVCPECGHVISLNNQQRLGMTGAAPPTQPLTAVQDRSDIPMA